jgi:Protein of unknown function (DUF2637)
VSPRALRVLTGALVATIGALAFLVSFEAISSYAVRVGAFSPGLRWTAPLLVDTFTVAATLVILARSQDGSAGRAWYAWSMVIVASTVSIVLNVAHAPARLDSRLVAALPSVALLGSLELVMSEARRLRGTALPVHSTSRERVRALLAQDPDVDVAMVREVTGVGQRRAYALLSQVRAESNGDGS